MKKIERRKTKQPHLLYGIICILFLVLQLISNVAWSQIVPFPGILLDQNELNTTYNGDIINYGEVKTTGSLTYNTTGGHKHTQSGQAITLTQGTTISSDNGKTADLVIDSEHQLAWFYPATSTPAEVLKNDHIEVGLKLHDTIEQQIHNFVVNNSDPNKINPFNPEEVDIKATFYKLDNNQWQWYGQTYAFYFQDYERLTTNWIQENTDYKMRVRFSPRDIGTYKCEISVKINGGPETFITPFAFKCVPSNLEGFMEVSDNKRYFEVDDETFFPVGQNMPYPYHPDLSGIHYSHNNVKMKPKGYTRYLDDLTDLKNAGANYFRVFMEPVTFEIEFEKLNNYSDRMNQAWELDQMVAHAESLGLKFTLNLLIHFALEEISAFGSRNWDWSKNTDPVYDIVPSTCQNSGDENGYCYRNELGLVDPHEFLTNADVRVNFKRRARYIVSRWGYSRSIGAFQFISEFNALWNGSIVNDTNCRPAFSGIDKYYDNLDNIPNKIAAFNIDMANYIKDHLKHNEHLLTASYAGPPAPENDDFTILSDNIDFIDFNHYSALPKVYEGDKIYHQRYQTPDSNYFANKPIMNSEVSNVTCDSMTNWKKSVLLFPFTGISGSLPWQLANTNYLDSTTIFNVNDRNDAWSLLGTVNSYMSQFSLGQEDWRPDSYTHPDQLYDVIYLRKTNNSEYVGAINNRTHNSFTTFDGDSTSDCFFLTEEPESEFPETNDSAIVISSNFLNEGPAEIKNTVYNATYLIEYFDPFSGNVLGSITWDTHFDSNEGQENLKFGFPDLSADATMPVVYFHATLLSSGNLAQDTTMDSQSIQQELSSEEQLTLINEQLPYEKKVYSNISAHSDAFTEDNTNDIHIYPNPTDKNVQVTVDHIASGKYYLYDALGKMVMEGNALAKFDLNLEKLEKGLYLLIIKTEEQTLQTKIIKS